MQHSIGAEARTSLEYSERRDVSHFSKAGRCSQSGREDCQSWALLGRRKNGEHVRLMCQDARFEGVQEGGFLIEAASFGVGLGTDYRPGSGRR